MELFRIFFTMIIKCAHLENTSGDTYLLQDNSVGSVNLLRYAHALRFAVGLHGTQKFHPIVKDRLYQISSGARASLVVL